MNTLTTYRYKSDSSEVINVPEESALVAESFMNDVVISEFPSNIFDKVDKYPFLRNPYILKDTLNLIERMNERVNEGTNEITKNYQSSETSMLMNKIYPLYDELYLRVCLDNFCEGYDAHYKKVILDAIKGIELNKVK